MAEPISSKKWVDYSDEDSSQEEEHPPPVPPPQQTLPPMPQQVDRPEPTRPSPEEINAELDRLDELDDMREEEVWLLMTSCDQSYLEEEAKYLKSKAKKGGNIVSVLPSRTPNAYDVKVYIDIAYDYIQKGYDGTHKINFTVAQRNFEPQQASREPRRGRPAELKQKNSQNEKKRYVDKETGLQPEPKKKKEEETTQNDRKYSKQEAERKGELLANFRAKSKKEQEAKPQSHSDAREESKQEVRSEAKPEVKQERVQVKEVKEKKEKKGKGGSKFASQNRFEGIEDLS